MNTHSVPFSCACLVQRWWSNVGLTLQVARRASRRILVTMCRTNSQLRWSRSALRSPPFQDTCHETCRLPDGNIFTVTLERLRLTRTLSFIGTTRLSNVSRSATLTSARPYTLASAKRLQGVKERELPLGWRRSLGSRSYKIGRTSVPMNMLILENSMSSHGASLPAVAVSVDLTKIV